MTQGKRLDSSKTECWAARQQLLGRAANFGGQPLAVDRQGSSNELDPPASGVESPARGGRVSVVAIAVKFTGDFAVDVNPTRLAEARTYLDRHEESADQATTAVFLLGLAAAVALYLGRGERVLPTWTLAVLVALGIGTSVLYARSANLGGQINHPELRSAGPK